MIDEVVQVIAIHADPFEEIAQYFLAVVHTFRVLRYATLCCVSSQVCSTK
jgi:hypothetical protein